LEPLPQYDEKGLLNKMASGTEVCFRQLYDVYHERIYSFAFFLTHSDTLAKDISQEIFIKIWTHRTELANIRNFNAWLKTIIRNHVYTCLKRIATERIILQKISPAINESANSTETEVLQKEYSRLLHEAISHLPPQQKKVYLLSRQHGLKHDEIARNLGLSTYTVKNHMKAALQAIKLFLHNYHEALLCAGLILFF